MEGTRLLTTTRSAASQRVSLKLWGPPTQFCLGTFTAECLKNNFRFKLGGVAQSWFRGWPEFPVAVQF